MSFSLTVDVPAVVAGLWQVDDRPMAELMTAFHRHLGGGADPLRALHSAQLELFTSSDEVLRSPASWAGFEVLGGVALDGFAGNR